MTVLQNPMKHVLLIVDDAENGLASTTIGAGMAEINIGASCTSFVAR